MKQLLAFISVAAAILVATAAQAVTPTVTYLGTFASTSGVAAIVLNPSAGVAAGDIIAVYVGMANTTVSSVVDSKNSGSYTCNAAVFVNGLSKGELCYKLATAPLTTSDSITVTTASSSGSKQIFAADLSGVSAQDSVGSGNCSNSCVYANSPSSGQITIVPTVTPSTTPAVILGSIVINSSSTATTEDPNGWTTLAASAVGTNTEEVRWAYKVTPSGTPAATTYAPSIAASKQYIATEYVYTGAGGGGGGSTGKPRNLPLMGVGN